MSGSQTGPAAAASASSTTAAAAKSRNTMASLLSTVRSVKMEHLVGGVSGGVISTLVLHPLDLLKIRFAVDDGKLANRPHYNGLGHAFTSIFKQEGFKGLYKGVTPNVAGAGTSWGLYFLFYNTVKTDMQGGDTKMPLTPGMHMLAAAEAGILTLAMTNPIWVVKTRLCLQYGNEIGDKLEAAAAGNKAGSKAAAEGQQLPKPSTTTAVQSRSAAGYKGMIDALVRIFKEEGFRGLYKGFVPGIWGVSHGAIQFMAYEELKNTYSHYKNQPIDTKLATGEYLFFAALSKLFAAVTTYPYQVIRARLQDQHSRYNGAVDCLRTTLRNEGVSGFYKGLKPNLMRVVPATAITFVVYEQVTHHLASYRQ